MTRQALVTTLLLLTSLLTQAESQNFQPSLVELTPTAQRIPPSQALLECGRYHYKANLRWTGDGLLVLANFENPAAEAVCGNAIYNADEFNSSPRVETGSLSRINLKPVNSYVNGTLNYIVSKFNPELVQTLVKGKSYYFSCNRHVAPQPAKILELHNPGLISLKFNDPELESMCGEGRYLAVDDLLKLTTQAKRHANETHTVYSTEVGYMSCGNNYYSVRALQHFSGSSLVMVHFFNANAEAVCGNSLYEDDALMRPRGPIGTENPRFIAAQKNYPFGFLLNDTSFKANQIVDQTPCKNNLGKAVVTNTIPNYGFVTFRFYNAQLNALCGQGRYYKASEVLANGDALMRKQANGSAHIMYFAE